jgi:hypothetical protein
LIDDSKTKEEKINQTAEHQNSVENIERSLIISSTPPHDIDGIIQTQSIKEYYHRQQPT